MSSPSSKLRVRVVTLVLCWAVLMLPSSATSQEPLGSEFQVNSYTTGGQKDAAVAVDDGGDFVVVWDCQSGICGQRYDAAGSSAGDEFQVNTSARGLISHVAVATSSADGFVVVWRVRRLGRPSYVVGRRFDDGGSPLGIEFPVNIHTSYYSSVPAVAMAPNGDFVVVFESIDQDGSETGVFGQRFNAVGSRLGVEFQVNTYWTGHQVNPQVSSDRDGNFVVVWQRRDYGTIESIFGQRFDALGSRLGGEFRASVSTMFVERSGDVAAAGDGSFVVVWGGEEGKQWDVLARQFGPSGYPVGEEIQVNTWTLFSQSSEKVSSDPEGNFVVVWESFGQDGDKSGIFGQAFDSDGTSRNSEFQIQITPTRPLFKGTLRWGRMPGGTSLSCGRVRGRTAVRRGSSANATPVPTCTFLSMGAAPARSRFRF